MIDLNITSGEFRDMTSTQKYILLYNENPNHKCFKCERFWEKYYGKRDVPKNDENHIYSYRDEIFKCYSIGNNFCDVLNFKKPTSGMDLKESWINVKCTDATIRYNSFCILECADFEEHTDHEIYSEYLKSDLWKQRRMDQLKKDGFKCTMCGTAKNLHVHHITYENALNEKDGDLITLCEECHSNVHNSDEELFGKGNYPSRVIRAEELLILYKVRNPKYKINYPDLVSDYAKGLLDALRGRSGNKKYRIGLAYLIAHNNEIEIKNETVENCIDTIAKYKLDKSTR